MRYLGSPFSTGELNLSRDLPTAARSSHEKVSGIVPQFPKLVRKVTFSRHHGILNPLTKRQANPECAALSRCAVDRNVTTMRFENTPHNRQSQPRTGPSGRVVPYPR